MALEYVKVWTTFLDDPWVQSLNCNHRGFFLQLLILCRRSGDFSAIFRRGLSALGAELGCDDSTCAKILRKFAEDGKVIFEKRPDGVYRIEVVNYQFWQDLRPEKQSREIVAKKRQTGEKSEKIQPSKPREEKPSQAKPISLSPNGDHREFVDYFCRSCKEHTGVEYLFQGGKDGQKVKGILAQLKSVDLAKAFVDEFFRMDDDFLRESGHTIGVFSVQLNKIAQRLSGSRIDGESSTDRHNRLLCERMAKALEPTPRLIGGSDVVAK